MLKIPYEFWIGARYAGLARIRQRRGRRDRFISFVAASSMAGIALGVAALIVVLSVMNGFQKEVRDRMLSVLPHIELYIPGAAPERVLDQWQQYADAAKKNPAVKAGAPFVAAQGMLVRAAARRAGARHRSRHRGRRVRPAQADGHGQAVRPEARRLWRGAGQRAGRRHGREGRRHADDDGAARLDQPAGFAPRMRQFTVVGVFSSGHYEYDSSLAFVDDEDAARVFRDSGTAGVRLRVADMQRAPEVAAELAQVLPPYMMASDWSRNNRTWFAAVKTEKRMMFLILALIVAVAAFNLLSSLVMAVRTSNPTSPSCARWAPGRAKWRASSWCRAR